MNRENGFFGKDINRCGTCGAQHTSLEECGVETECRNLLGGLPSEIIISESADKIYRMAKFPRVGCKIQGSSTEPPVVREDVPENLADRNDAVGGNVM